MLRLLLGSIDEVMFFRCIDSRCGQSFMIISICGFLWLIASEAVWLSDGYSVGCILGVNY